MEFLHCFRYKDLGLPRPYSGADRIRIYLLKWGLFVHESGEKRFRNRVLKAKVFVFFLPCI